MNMLKILTSWSACIVLLVSMGRGQDDAQQKPAAGKEQAVAEKVVSEKDAIKQLVGNYRVVSGEKSGEQILPERLADVTVRITEKTITTYDGDRQQRFGAAYRLDTMQRPWRLKMVPTVNPTPAAGQNSSGTAAASEGLVEITENGAKLIYALPSGETPKRFKAAARQQLFILERLKEPGEKPTTPKASSSEGASSAK